MGLNSTDFITRFSATGIQVVVLGTAVRSGSFLLHSFVDNHPNVLHVPKQHFYPFDWADRLQHSPAEQLLDNYWHHSYHLKGRIPRLGATQTHTTDLHFPAIRQRMKAIANTLSESLTRKTLLLLFYAAYADVHGIDLANINVLFIHSHFLPTLYGHHSYRFLRDHYLTPSHLRPLCNTHRLLSGDGKDPVLDRLLSDFPNAKLINTIRHPMAGVYSYLADWQRQTHWEVVHQQDLSSCFARSWFSLLGMASSIGLHHRLGNHILNVKFDDIHQQLEATMAEVANFMGLRWHPTLLESTFAGHPWVAKIGDAFHQGVNPTRLANETRWQTEWDDATIHALLPIADPLGQALGYPPVGYSSQQPVTASTLLPMEAAAYHHQPSYLTAETAYMITRNHVPTDAIGIPPNQPLQEWGDYLATLPKRYQFWQQYPQLQQRTVQALHAVATQYNPSPMEAMV